MGLLDNLEPIVKTPLCIVRRTADTLEPSDAKILLDAVESHDWGFTDLVRALASRGVKLSDNSLRRHRFGSCACRSN